MHYPLMENNIDSVDIAAVRHFLSDHNVRLTNGPKVEEFESSWSEWLGVDYSVFVNSGASANFITMLVFRQMYGCGEVIVPSFTWISDISSLLLLGFKPVFVDVDLNTLSMGVGKIKAAINKTTKAIFLTHAQGFSAISDELLDICDSTGIKLIEDCCESHGATFSKRKIGVFGWASNFSFFYAHHMSTIEGGMVSTNNPEVYQWLRMARSHGMLREANNPSFRHECRQRVDRDLNDDFIFMLPTLNFRSSEINAVLGLSQLQKLDVNIHKRTKNFKYFLKNLPSEKWFSEFLVEGSSNYAFPIILREKNEVVFNRLKDRLDSASIEYRVGSVGGGNQLRQPYLREFVCSNALALDDFPVTEHIHRYGMYVGNYPSLEQANIDCLLEILDEC